MAIMKYNIRIRHNDEIYVAINNFKLNGISYYTMINKEGNVLFLKFIEDPNKNFVLGDITSEEQEEINNILIKRGKGIYGPELSDLILNNQKVSLNYKNILITAAEKILVKYPNMKQKLLSILESITVRVANETEEQVLKKEKTETKIILDSNDGPIAIISENCNDYDIILYLFIHELFHCYYYDKDNNRTGFYDLSSQKGVSLNEGITEYLTKTVYDNEKAKKNSYYNDLINICLMSSIININDIIDSCSDGGMKKLHELYSKKVGNTISFYEIATNMDYDHITRTGDNKIIGDFKEQYISTIIEDYKRVVWHDIWFTDVYVNLDQLNSSLNYLKDLVLELIETNKCKDDILQQLNDVSLYLNGEFNKCYVLRTENMDKFSESVANL